MEKESMNIEDSINEEKSNMDVEKDNEGNDILMEDDDNNSSMEPCSLETLHALRQQLHATTIPLPATLPHFQDQSEIIQGIINKKHILQNKTDSFIRFITTNDRVQ